MKDQTSSMYRAGLLLLAMLLSCTAGVSPAEDVAETTASVSLSITVTNAVGRVVSAGNGLARTFHSYDDLNRDSAVQHVLDGTSYVYSSAYGYPQSAISVTGLGTVVTSTTFPDSEVVSYTYDAGGAEQTITATPSGGTAQTVVSKQVRNARGQTTEVDYGDGLKQVHCYDETTDLRLNAIKTGTWSGTPSCTTAATSLVQSYGYTFDPDANVTTVNDYCTAAVPGVCCDPAGGSCTAQAMSATYTYDSLNELITAASNGTTNYYSYDNVGNLTCMQGASSGCGNQTYPAQGAGSVRPRAISSSTASGSSVTFAYDADGNTTSTSAGIAIHWDSENMATQVMNGSTTINQKWFVGETLWKKVEGTTTTHYLPAMRNEGGGYRKYYSAFAERDWTDTTSCTVNASKGCLKFYHSDHLGSSAVATTSTGSVVYRHSYWPYGGDRSLLGTFTPKYEFNFMEKDASGFYDYGARMYNDVTGRFLSADTVLSEAAYAYANNNPIHYTDPTGHTSSFDCLATLSCPTPPTPVLGQQVPVGLLAYSQAVDEDQLLRQGNGAVTNALSFVEAVGGVTFFAKQGPGSSADDVGLGAFHTTNAWNVVSNSWGIGTPLQQAAAANAEFSSRYPVGLGFGEQFGSSMGGSDSHRIAGLNVETRRMSERIDDGFALNGLDGLTFRPGFNAGLLLHNDTYAAPGFKAGGSVSGQYGHFSFKATFDVSDATRGFNINNPLHAPSIAGGFRHEFVGEARYSNGRLEVQGIVSSGRNAVGVLQWNLRRNE